MGFGSKGDRPARPINSDGRERAVAEVNEPTGWLPPPTRPGERASSLHRRAQNAEGEVVRLKRKLERAEKAAKQWQGMYFECANGKGMLYAALKPLVAIANAYDDNELDDEARKRWGPNLEFTSQIPPREIELYAGRGGRQLLTLADALTARELVNK